MPASDGKPLPFETLFYDTVDPSWNTGRHTKALWLSRHILRGKKQPDVVYDVEEQLYRRSPSSFLLSSRFTGVRQANSSSTFLPTLSPSDCKEVPRVDMAMIDGYVDRWVDHVWLVDAIIPPSTSVTRAVFKTTRMPVLGTPLALVTVDADQDQRDDINTPHDKYVGMLPYYTGSLDAVGFKTDEDLKRRLRYGQRFVLGVRHLSRSGIFIGDLGLRNTVISAPPPDDRLILIDFEPLSFYTNAGGLIAPEADGSWDNVSQDSDGKLVYEHCDNPVSKISTIRTEWANTPQALERLEVFGVGTTLAALLKCSACFPWKKSLQPFSIHRTDPNIPSKEADEEWEARIPPAFKDLVQRCCSYDPRDRPLLDEIVSTLEQWA
ncbi:unnamed protein product [Tilletia laevis]|uniref:Protein kinase domain-containing protein n=1 Tax=Tilletia laevis TaxID=157183 RepID=A0A9N8Q803_9BASI|nr:unnamed protein product [Tilletia laevis]